MRVGVFTGLGVFVSCVVLELLCAAAVTIGSFTGDSPTASFTDPLP